MNKLVPAAVVLTVGAVLQLTMPRAEAQFSSPVRVVNPVDSPVPVKTTQVTLSARLQENDDEIVRYRAPACPLGTEFLVSALAVSTRSSEQWVVRVRTVQRFQVGLALEVDLELFGEGQGHASQVLPAGQALHTPGTVEISLQVDHNDQPLSFQVHVSGYCGVAHVVQNLLIG